MADNRHAGTRMRWDLICRMCQIDGLAVGTMDDSSGRLVALRTGAHPLVARPRLALRNRVAEETLGN